DLVERLATCRAVCYPPSAEDYGLVTLEAFASAKAVITCADSGGPAEMVRPDVDGLVADPTGESLAQAMRRIMDDQALAERLGGAGCTRAADYTWARTIPRLLGG
ncbi:MAG TPA: glycosyl transferase family 1, partial [Acidobacteria bacterium]|nr:glycosyl transferase family 1 [Acidobacteriota bacterium]